MKTVLVSKIVKYYAKIKLLFEITKKKLKKYVNPGFVIRILMFPIIVKEPCSSQLSDGFKILLITMDNCTSLLSSI